MGKRLEIFTGETQATLIGLLRRAPRTINDLAAALDLTDNAVRNHVAALTRDGIVEDAGADRGTGGKPARVYALTADGEELFPKAYARMLGEFIDEVARTEGRDRVVELLRSVGTRVASGTAPPRDIEGRVRAAAELLRSVGAEIDVRRTHNGWRLQGHGCPLSAVTATRPDACLLTAALVEGVTGPMVTECCQRGERPRCAFEVAHRGV